ncbi:hypothetical protein Pmani_000227 [Petrolisthes manimaculis]|uniref:Integrase zinc-binding domain-containing protein n=1 Tax=Petrolisthes manimaculis TaxID=1843537 RepID=A0AAE1QMY5_9EUCA|nr:hypothetical protein Pmani_000227 [Petrolisthes manimaculis]
MLVNTVQFSKVSEPLLVASFFLFLQQSQDVYRGKVYTKHHGSLKKKKIGLIPKCDYQKTIDALKAAADNSHAKGRLGYYLLEKYEELQCRPTEKLIKRRSTRQESSLYYVSIEETFDVVKSAHISTRHCGRDRLLKELHKKYANISTKAVELLKSLCKECQKKRKRPMTKGVVVRPILTKEFSSRGQVDLIGPFA